jgi:quercetin dioxygenase-like cupin family protein
MTMMTALATVFGFLALSVSIYASDPELTSDFMVPAGVNASSITGDFFTYTGFRNFSAPPGTFALKKATLEVFPALAGLGVGVTIVDFEPKTLNPPHHHPRGTEVLYVTEGSLHVGLVDSTGKLYTQSLQTGDLFVFPKGLVHFQINMDETKSARGVASFSSANAGTTSLPKTLFGSGIDAVVLEKAFSISSETLAGLEAPYPRVP